MTTIEIVKANGWPADFAESIDRIGALIDRQRAS